MNNNYLFDENFDWSVLPSNTAFAYISNNEFKDYYTSESIKFMKNVINNKMCIRDRNLHIIQVKRYIVL